MQCLPILLVCSTFLVLCLALEQYQPAYLSRNLPLDAAIAAGAAAAANAKQFAPHKKNNEQRRAAAAASAAADERNNADEKFSWLKYILTKPQFSGDAQYIPGQMQKSQQPHFVYDSTNSANSLTSGNSPNYDSAATHFFESQQQHQQQQQQQEENVIPSAHKRQSADILGKRFTNFALPYFKYKRNNGIWIWMPAQGYVSVPKDQQALENAEAAKQGKIMRYGK